MATLNDRHRKQVVCIWGEKLVSTAAIVEGLKVTPILVKPFLMTFGFLTRQLLLGLKFRRKLSQIGLGLGIHTVLHV